ncbi:hypothetical protein D6C78_06536 [Aureobasidium pullulans]|uniref:Mitochondrial carrier n=1 Tax=Aureobasidium pullulans TaxID=5580 RepID=A0A4T0BTB6_AURPU|nr:hypothetical protein D6C78_06536 [Aureobasidium pullulans]
MESFIARRAFVSAPIRSFQTAPVLRVGKESALPFAPQCFTWRHSDPISKDQQYSKHRKLTQLPDEEGRAEEVERVKNEQIQKQKEGKGHWHEEIASDSESIVKADRGDISADADTIKQLQKETEKLASQKK